MWLLNHDLLSVRALSRHEQDLLVGYVQATLRGQDELHANTLLKSIRADKHWIGCDCRIPMPALNIALKDSGRFVLRNNPDGPQHVEGCPFSHDLIKLKTKNHPTDHGVNRIGGESHIALHREFYGDSKGNTGQNSRSDAINGPSERRKLLSLALTLVERSGLTVYDPSRKATLTEQFEALRQSTSSYTLSPGLALSSYFETRLSKKSLVTMSIKLRNEKGFGNARRVGLLLDTVADIKGRSMKLAPGGELDFFGHVERRWSRSYPSLALATVTAQIPKSSFFEIGNIATLPVLSKNCLFPVCDEHDRECTASIFGLLDWFHASKGITIKAVRHLFAVDGGLSLELRSSKLIICIRFQDFMPEQGVDLPSPKHELKLSDFPDLRTMKKAITRNFLGAHHA